jgi:putative transposase
MSIYQGRCHSHQSFQLLLKPVLQDPGLPFADILGEDQIRQAFADAGVDFAQGEKDVYTPAVTLWAFLSQVLHKEEQRSCEAAVSRVITLLTTLGRPPCSDNSGAYCRARAKLPEEVLQRLTLQVGHGLERLAPADWRWHGRRVMLVDGTTASGADTVDNQKAFPQSSSQKPGLGFPVVRIVMLLSLATAAMCGMALGPCAGKETGETALFRQLLDQLQRGDIVVADRYFASYFMAALLLDIGVDFAFRQHQQRTTDFRLGRHLGKGDHIVVWTRPERPDWMDQETYERMPETLTVREVAVQVDQPGFRTESMVVVTSLTDAQTYTKDDIGDLYHQRWHVEIDIRAIKTMLGMDVLRCRTPEMLRKEIWVHLLAYNLLRKMNAQSALLSEVRLPREIGLTAAMQKAAASWVVLATASAKTARLLAELHLKHLAGHRVGNRPNRVEPRAVKRRRDPIALLTEPRAEARAKLINQKGKG